MIHDDWIQVRGRGCLYHPGGGGGPAHTLHPHEVRHHIVKGTQNPLLQYLVWEWASWSVDLFPAPHSNLVWCPSTPPPPTVTPLISWYFPSERRTYRGAVQEKRHYLSSLTTDAIAGEKRQGKTGLESARKMEERPGSAAVSCQHTHSSMEGRFLMFHLHNSSIDSQSL